VAVENGHEGVFVKAENMPAERGLQGPMLAATPPIWYCLTTHTNCAPFRLSWQVGRCRTT